MNEIIKALPEKEVRVLFAAAEMIQKLRYPGSVREIANQAGVSDQWTWECMNRLFLKGLINIEVELRAERSATVTQKGAKVLNRMGFVPGPGKAEIYSLQFLFCRCCGEKILAPFDLCRCGMDEDPK